MVHPFEHASSSTLVIDSFVLEGAVDPVDFEDTYDRGAGKNAEHGCRVLVLQRAERTVARSNYGREGHWALPSTDEGILGGERRPLDFILNRIAQSLGVWVEGTVPRLRSGRRDRAR
jgi:hypothetical protein